MQSKFDVKEKFVKTIEVFGVSNSNIASYIEREDVDTRFLEGLQRQKHIIVFGSSKQGKTALTNKHLQEDSFVRICFFTHPFNKLRKHIFKPFIARY